VGARAKCCCRAAFTLRSVSSMGLFAKDLTEMDKELKWSRAEFNVGHLSVWLLWGEESTECFAIASETREFLETLPLHFDEITSLPKFVEENLMQQIGRIGSIREGVVCIPRPFVGRKRGGWDFKQGGVNV